MFNLSAKQSGATIPDVVEMTMMPMVEAATTTDLVR